MPKKKVPSVKDRLQHIEQLVHKLENSEIELEDALRSFGEGTRLILETQEILRASEQEVQKLLDHNSEMRVEKFVAEDDE